MALKNASSLGSRVLSVALPCSRGKAVRGFFVLLTFLSCPLSARAQLQQPFVFAVDTAGPNPGILVFTRNDATGVLTPVPGSPFPSKAPVNLLALDFNGRFLFVGTSASNIEMYSIDSNTGALQEVPNSPFASTHTSSPVFLSTESSGQFLYVVNDVGSKFGASSAESFQIDPVDLDLIPTAAGAADLPGLFVEGATHPSGKSFYVFVNDPTSNPPNQPHFLLFNSANGTFTMPAILPPGSAGANSMALDPQGRYIALGVGPFVVSQDLQLDGTFGSSNISIPVIGTPVPMYFDPLGQFLYVTLPVPGSPGTQAIHFYSPATLQELPNSPLPASFASTSGQVGHDWILDPTAPLIYADDVYQVDPQTGLLNSILLSDPLSFRFPQSAVFSISPGSQPIQSPVALLSSNSLSFGTLTVGQTSSAQTMTISSIGGQGLSLNSTTITGTNASDFSITGDSCHAPTVLQPGTACSLLMSFTPSASGARSASLTITDNATPPSQSVSLGGTGLAPAPAVTLIPGNLNFNTVTQGTSTSLNISVTNSGNAALHISSVTVGGANAKDYSSSSPTCTSPIAVNASCRVAVTFLPLAPGVRTATVTLTDDAPDSPQVVDLTGNANPAFVAGAAPGGSTAAAVSAGQSAQFQLRLTPGTGYSGTISLTCSGAPLGAACQVPSSIALTNGAPASFTVTVTTSGPAILPPSAPFQLPPISWTPFLPVAFLVLSLLMVMLSLRRFNSAPARNRSTLLVSGALTFVLWVLVISNVAGCGGGGTASVAPPPPVITPSGNSTIIVTPSATSSTGQPLQLSPIQLTLTVK